MTTLAQIPAGARIPIGNPSQWLAAAIAADWQCQCITAAKGKAKQACGRSHWDNEDHRCRHRAAGAVAVHLILAPDANGVTLLLCEDCAKGHASTAASKQAAEPEPDPATFGQDSLFDLAEGGR
jgi:hypothetical protein